MRGTDANTGKPLAGIEHLRQSVRDILTTPIGSRVMRREYGSQLFAMVDAPLNRSTVMDLYAATAEALRRWEPRVSVTSIKASAPSPGVVTLDLVGVYLPDGRVVTIDGIVVN
ncbi:MAG TPA: GPW/gp25 family protein [Pyrinomonadaceae bacterium]|nr:GPW/gp25 family protein [Pyrinomonadaceae bacterium]